MKAYASTVDLKSECVDPRFKYVTRGCAEYVEWLGQKEKDWGIDTIEYWESDDGYFHFEIPYTGWVDEDMLSGFLKEENISLEEYLTNKKYVVIQDGDEYCYWLDMKRVGLVNMDAIDHEYPKDDDEMEN